MSETHFELTAKAPKIEQMLEQTALSQDGDPPYVHSDVYLDADEDEGLEIIQSSGGGSVISYTSWDTSYFDEISGSGLAMLNVEEVLDYLGVAADGGRLSMAFTGPEDSVLAQKLHAEGALTATVALPANQGDLDEVPQDFPERWNDENNLLSPSGNPHQATIQTTCEEVQKIIKAVALDEEMDFYPISIRDGEFVVNVSSSQSQNSVEGELNASLVEGPDMLNWYDPGFIPAFEKTLSGDVELQSTPGEKGGYPMAVVQESEDRTIRHLLVEVNPT